MKNKKFSVSLTIIFCALLVQVQAAHAQDAAPPDTTWDADPLDVLDKKEETPLEPSVPEFTEIPAPDSNQTVETPPPPAAPDVPTPEVPSEVPAPTHADAGYSNTTAAAASDDPDFNKENRFHNIYKKYNETPTSDEAWDKAVGARKSEVYKVEKGNTLWDISNTFFGDPNFWPKLWSLNNGSILNPHEITPDMNIKFYPGTMMDAPTLAVAGKDGEAATENEADKVVEPSVSEPAIPPSRRKHVPVLGALPNSLPKGRFGVYDDSTSVEVEFRENKMPTAFEFLSYYVADEAVSGPGKITGTEVDSKTANEFQYVYVQFDNGTPEKNYIAQKNMGEVDDPGVKGRKARMVEIQGGVEILEKVNAEKNIYRAIVKKAIQPVEVGAVLVPGEVPMIDPTPGAVSNIANAKIMGGEFGKRRGMFSSNSLIFLDGGTSKGFAVGQNLSIFADSALRNKQSGAILNDRTIGSLKIVKVTPNFATAYVTNSTDDILLGDYVGNGAKTASVDKDVVESHEPETQEQIDNELDMGGQPAVDTGPGSEELDLEL
ncbi:LysM domain-containing protein [Bdellovibrio sp. SKB1291214]|nr:LysM domain-containing protein [Bdellovibrio sp. SKB1291214]UYL07621.1 LysM domain-containing protein [Bdellovibrio sp. SKB1291214]